jgi:phospholipid/cholesterol/gamma-HCH transport system permease protein
MPRANIHTLDISGDTGGDVAVAVSGRMALGNLQPLLTDLLGILEERRPARLRVDLAGVTFLDSSGAMVLKLLEQRARERAAQVAFVNLSGAARALLGLMDEEALRAAPLIPPKAPEGFIEKVGGESLKLLEDAVHVLTFVGELLRALCHALRHPRSVRWRDVLLYMERTGVDGLPIVGLISFLMGLIMAFMSSLQLKQFGANIYVASLVALAMIRELGPIITAILVAGRSGSAFAAEIGTMKVNEEVDALVAMGFDPTRFLAVPKVLAAMATVPLLTVFADVFAILGGLVVGVAGLDLTLYTYIQQTLDALRLFDIVSSLIKSVVFAMLISGIGCQRGFQVRGGAQAVGMATTSAVVAAMFLIIVADSAFAVLLYYI